MPVAAFTVNHICLFKYRTRESEIEQVPNYTLYKGKGKKESINHKILKNGYCIKQLFTEEEVNSTWLITSELANQRAQKALFTCVVYTNC